MSVEINLEKINQALDRTRICLNVNFESTDDNRGESWELFIDEVNKLKMLLDMIPTDKNVTVYGVLK